MQRRSVFDAFEPVRASDDVAQVSKPTNPRRKRISTDAEIRAAQPGRWPCGDNLFLVVTETLGRQFTYRGRDLTGRDVVRKLGNYPEVSLAQARLMVRAEQVARTQGRSTLTGRRRQEARGTKLGERFSVCAVLDGDIQAFTLGQWATLYMTNMYSAGHWTASSEYQIRRNVVRYLQTVPLWYKSMVDIDLSELAQLCNDIAQGRHVMQTKRKGVPSIAKFVRGIVYNIFRYAITEGAKGVINPTDAIIIHGEKRMSRMKSRLPSVVDMNEAARVLNAIMHSANLIPSIRNACILQAFTAHRTSVIRRAEWSEFDLDAAVPTWTVPRHKMKMSDDVRGDYIMPLDRALAAWLKQLPRTGRYLFPGQNGPNSILSVDAMTRAYRVSLQLKGRMVPHGWRAVYATWAKRRENDKPVHDPVAAEWGLDHEPRSTLDRIYTREMCEARAVAMQPVLKDYRDTLRRALSGEVIAKPKLDPLLA